jgi:hypothetical protein
MLGTIRKLPMINWRKVGTISGHHGLYRLGHTHVTMGVTTGSEGVILSQSLKALSVQIAGCNSPA